MAALGALLGRSRAALVVLLSSWDAKCTLQTYFLTKDTMFTKYFWNHEQYLFLLLLAVLGLLLAALRLLLGRPWPLLRRSWALLARSWAAFGALLAALGPLLAALGPFLSGLGPPQDPPGSAQGRRATTTQNHSRAHCGVQPRGVLLSIYPKKGLVLLYLFTL